MPSDVQSGGRRGYRVPASRSVVRKKRVPNRVGAFASPGVPKAAPLAGAQQQAARRVARAQAALPKRPTPALPVLERPTRKQTKAAVDLAKQSRNRSLPPGPITNEAQDAYNRELASDPRQADYTKTVRRYTQRAAADDFAASGRAVAEQLQRGAGRRITRAQAILIGRDASSRSIRQGNAVGPPDVKLSAAGLNVNLTDVGRTIAGATSLQSDSPENAFARRTLGDVKALGEAPFIATYELGAGAVDVARGRGTGRLQKLGKGVAKGVEQSVPGQLVQGKLTGAADAFNEHPLFGLLDTAGAIGAAGRVAGAAARGAGSTVEGAGVRGALARAGSTVRPPIALTDDISGGIVERAYSKDLSRKAFQVAADDQREVLLDGAGKPVMVKQRGRMVPVLKAYDHERERLQRREGDFDASRANSRERLDRDVAGREGRVRGGRKGVKGKKARDLVAMAADGTITTGKHFEQDLRGYRDSRAALLAEHDRQVTATGHSDVFSHSDDVKTARARVEAADAALASPKVLEQAEKIAKAGEDHGRALVATDAEKARLGIGDAEELRRARLKTVAIEHMGARHFTVEDHARLERDALTHEKAARERFAAASTPAERRVAAAEVRAARDERIAVSGREPAKVTAHERAQAQARNARTRERQGAAQINRLQQKRARLVGAQSSRRGRRQQDGDGAATVAEKRKLAKVDQEIRAATQRRQEALTEARRLEHAARETPMPKAGEGLRTAEGKHLPTSEIEDFLRARGRDPDTVAYLPQRPGTRGGAFHTQFRPGSRPTTSGETRTGEAFRKGIVESSAELLREEHVRSATQIAKAEQIDRMVADHGIRHPAWAKAQRGAKLTAKERKIVNRGGLFTAREFEELRKKVEADTGQRLVGVRAYAAKLDAETQRIIREDYQGPGGMETLGQRLLNNRLLEDGDVDSRARNIVGMPAAYVEQIERHLKPAGGFQRTMQYVNRWFRLAVLPQPRWLTGNFVEPYLIRLPTVGSGLVNLPGMAMDVAAARKVLRELERSGDPKMRAAAKELRGQQLGGLFIGGRGAGVRRTAADLPGPLKYGAVVRELPVVKQVVDLAALAPKAFFAVNRAIEAGAQHAALGKSVRRDVQEVTGSWTKTITLGKEAAEEAARGLTNTSTQRRFMRAQHELLGKYEGWAPWMRNLTQGAFPFIPWSLAAARFVFWTMPAHRTTQTALLLKTAQVVQADWADQHQGLPPGGLQLAVPTKDGGWVDLARYTPYGLSGPVVEGDYRGVTSQAFPQGQGAYAALEGRDPFGRALQVPKTADNPDGTAGAGQRLGIAGNTLLESLVPGLSYARRLREGGATAYANSTVVKPRTKPDTAHGRSAIERVLSPFSPTFLGGGSTGGGAGGLDPIDLQDIRREVRGAGQGLDAVDLDEIRQAIRDARGG